MDNELMRACALYCEICDYTINGNGRGMSIKEIRKKYGLKRREMAVLLQFLIEIADMESCVEFVEYDTEGRIKETDLSNVDEAIGKTIGKKKKDVYIRIMDRNAFMPKERLSQEDFHIQNKTFLQNLNQNDVSEVVKKISNVLEEDLVNFVVNKGEKRNSLLERKVKHKLISAILYNRVTEITGYGQDARKKKVHPVGLYYIKLLEVYRLVYYEIYPNQKEEMELSQIKNVEILDETYDTKFNIYEYIEQKRTEKLILDVYREGNVVKKMDLILSEYDVQKDDKEDRIEYQFMAESADIFENVIKSFGRSVIVKEPTWLRDKILHSTEEILHFYEEGR